MQIADFLVNAKQTFICRMFLGTFSLQDSLHASSSALGNNKSSCDNIYPGSGRIQPRLLRTLHVNPSVYQRTRRKLTGDELFVPEISRCRNQKVRHLN